MDRISQIEVGDVCFFSTATALVLNITSDLSFSVYHCIDMDSGIQYRTHRYQLMKREVVLMFDDNDDDIVQEKAVTMIEVPEVTEGPEMPEVPEVVQMKNDRFATKTEDDLQAIEQNIKAKTTHTQTRWGVKIFKGKLFNICTQSKL